MSRSTTSRYIFWPRYRLIRRGAAWPLRGRKSGDLLHSWRADAPLRGKSAASIFVLL